MMEGLRNDRKPCVVSGLHYFSSGQSIYAGLDDGWKIILQINYFKNISRYEGEK